jgi:methionyl-tRNA synthetase
VNYISVVGIEGWEEHPADIHVMAKEIVRFHAVIWPAMLMSAGLPLPGQIVSTGFLTVDGTKMSKSLGNGVDPIDLAARYGNDAVRYFLLREVSFGDDGDFSEAKMRERYNADLANGLGNFAARVLTLAEKETLSTADATLDGDFDITIETMKRTVYAKLGEYKFSDALAAIWSAISFGDRYVNERKVWEIKDDAVRAVALFNLVSLLDAVATELVPFLPETSKKIKAAIVYEDGALKTKKPDILFPRIK